MSDGGEDDLAECRSCGYPARSLESYRGHMPGDPDRLLCEVCAGTLIGRATARPHLYQTTDQVAVKAIAWGINRILDEVRRKP